MNTNTMPAVFARYSAAKYSKFQKWLATKHGQSIYAMFRRFAELYREAGHDRCGANLIGNRVRWETDVGEYSGYKMCNDWLPMMARQLVIDDASFKDFFGFQATGADPEHDYDDPA